MTIKAHNKTTYTITSVKAGCKESSSWSEAHIQEIRNKKKNKNEQNIQAWKTRKDDNDNSSQETRL